MSKTIMPDPPIITTYELPTKGDLDRNLSVIFHAAHHKARAECGRLKSDFAARGYKPKEYQPYRRRCPKRRHNSERGP
jgi:hypothetical protein